jgi:hypothetical protein
MDVGLGVDAICARCESGSTWASVVRCIYPAVDVSMWAVLARCQLRSEGWGAYVITLGPKAARPSAAGSEGGEGSPGRTVVHLVT